MHNWNFDKVFDLQRLMRIGMTVSIRIRYSQKHSTVQPTASTYTVYTLDIIMAVSWAKW